MTVSRIRRAVPADVEAILAVNRASVPAVSELDAAEVGRLLGLASDFLVVEVADGLAAYLIAIDWSAAYDGEEFAWFSARYEDFVYIDQVAVAPQHRRRGLGTSLYEKIERAPRKRVSLLTCEVNLQPPNPESARFHIAREFEEVDRLATRDGRLVSLQVKWLDVGGEDTPGNAA